MKPSHAALDCGKAKSPVTAQIMNSKAEADAAKNTVMAQREDAERVGKRAPNAALDCGKAKSPVTAQIMNSKAEADAAMYMVIGRASPLPNTRLDTTTTMARPKAEK